MANEVDKAVAEAEQALRRILTSITLEKTEKEYVNNAARRLVDLAYEMLEPIPEERRWKMRAIVLAVAIATIIGPTLGARAGR